MQKSWFKAVTGHRVLLHLKDDNSIEGVLVDRPYRDGLALRGAELRVGQNSPTTMGGEVFVPRENIAFVQRDD